MGVQIKTYQNIKECSQDSDYDFQAYVIAPELGDRIKNLKNRAFYNGDVQEVQLSFPSSTLNNFRRKLCKMLDMPDPFQNEIALDQPFYELMEFADNEGVMDWDSASELYKDFVQHEVTALTSLHTVDEVDLYRKFMEICKLASVPNSVIVYS